MDVIQTLIERVWRVEFGFGPIKAEAEALVQQYSNGESLEVAKALLQSPLHQARMLATFILGMLAHGSSEALSLMREKVSRDEDWRVQEILAQAFDRYCADRGYEVSLPVMKEWLADPHANVRRAVTEGLRIWTTRPYFKQHPQVAVTMLGALHADESEYVRKSVGNALRDISRKHPTLIVQEIEHWDLSDKKALQTSKLASKFTERT
jgi:3-methyladenine DNA glycosylase AlkD